MTGRKQTWKLEDLPPLLHSIWVQSKVEFFLLWSEQTTTVSWFSLIQLSSWSFFSELWFPAEPVSHSCLGVKMTWRKSVLRLPNERLSSCFQNRFQTPMMLWQAAGSGQPDRGVVVKMSLSFHTRHVWDEGEHTDLKRKWQKRVHFLYP